MHVLPDTEPFAARYDAVVVGARCAGAAVAKLLAEAGLRVLAVDRRAYGADALSTHAIMRGGVYLLSRWGLLDELEAAGTPRIERTVFDYGRELIALDIEPRDDVPALYAPRRTVLDRVLADAATRAGAELRFGVSVEGLLRDGDRVTGVALRGAGGEVREIRAGLVIGADGRRSTVAQLVGAAPYLLGRHATAVVFGYFGGADVSANEWIYRPGLGIGAIPTNEGRACVFVGMPPERLRRQLRGGVDAGFRSALRGASPDLAERVERGRRDGGYRRFGGAPGFLRQSWGPGWALVGDAGYFKDPLTAHGITDALRDAALLARAVAAGGDAALADYQRRRDALSLTLFEVTDRIASCAWDIDELMELHLTLSKQMKRETRALIALEPTHSTVASTADQTRPSQLAVGRS